jgi:penicillin-binding protein 2
MKPSKLISWIVLFILLVFLVGCKQPEVTVTPTPTLTITPTLPQPEARTTQAPNVEAAARAYLKAWEAEDYPTMYAMLTAVSKDGLTEEQFTLRYRNVATEAAMSSVETQILSSLTQTRTAQVSYRVTLHSVLVGDISRDTLMNLSLENLEWHIQWDDSLILPELKGGNLLHMDYLLPSRGNIYDRAGRPLVAQADAVALGLIPSQINPETEDTLLNELWRLTGIRPQDIYARYENFPPGVDWYLPLASVTADDIKPRITILSALEGLVMQPFQARYYFEDGIAPHVVGYVSLIQEDEVEEYKRKGYRIDERVGRMGLEEWGEGYLSGKRGGALYVLSPDNQIVTKLAETSPAPAQAMYTTLDRDLQFQAQQALAGFLGAAVVLERNTGRVLAMVSTPGFDPNLFEPTNYNRSFLINDLFDQNTIPLLNRATQGQYPLGSVFKIITMAGALESGLYTAETTYECGYHFTELLDVTLHDWTWDHFQEDKKTQPSGKLTLPEGLMRSCNPFFYHIGLDLFDRGMIAAIPDMARGFGLGKATDIETLVEAEGQVPDLQSKLDATNLATGQGALLVTPLQVANFVAAVGNGGTLYRPQIVERITPPDAQATFTFQPEVRGTLPISAENLAIIQQAMVSVISNRRGTAFHRFTGLNIPVAGKTGTAQVPPNEPHAWFAGYTFAGRENKPDIAIAVILENAGEGSEYAAPIFRRLVEIYFYGQPRTLYWWESSFGVVRTPEPEATATPAP